MTTIVAIKGTNGSGKSTVVRELIAHLGKQAVLRVNNKDAGYSCKYKDGAIFALGKYKTAACGGLDSSFSYSGAADDLFFCIDKLAGQGHVVCEGVVAITSYGFDRVTRFADKQTRTGRRMIFARIDTPPELCIERVRQRRRESGNHKPFNPEKMLDKYESVQGAAQFLRRNYESNVDHSGF